MQNRFGLTQGIKKGQSKPLLSMDRRTPQQEAEDRCYAVDVGPSDGYKGASLVANLKWGRDGGSISEVRFDVGAGRRFQVSASNIVLSVLHEDDSDPTTPESVDVSACASWGSKGSHGTPDPLTYTVRFTLADGASQAVPVPAFAFAYTVLSEVAAGPFTVVASPRPTLTIVGALSPTQGTPQRLLAAQRLVTVTNNSGAPQNVVVVFSIGI